MLYEEGWVRWTDKQGETHRAKGRRSRLLGTLFVYMETLDGSLGSFVRISPSSDICNLEFSRL